MAQGWTPGPWQCVGWTPPGIYGPGGLRDAVRVAQIDRRIKVEEAEANANLIAAAPALYEALADCLAELSPLMQAYRPEHYEPICGKARAALSAARGDA